MSLHGDMYGLDMLGWYGFVVPAGVATVSSTLEAPCLRPCFVQEALTQLYGMGQVQSRPVDQLWLWRFPKSWGYPQIINGIFHNYRILLTFRDIYKQSYFLGTPIYGNPQLANSEQWNQTANASSHWFQWVSMAASGRRRCSWWLLHGTVIQEAIPLLKGLSCQCEEEKRHEERISWLVVPK